METANPKATFLTIPREIRDKIYDYLLLFDGEIFPMPYHYDREFFPKDACCTNLYFGSSDESQGRVLIWDATYRVTKHLEERLCVAILRLNKRIHREAAATLYGKNIFQVGKLPTHFHGFLNLRIVLPSFRRAPRCSRRGPYKSPTGD